MNAKILNFPVKVDPKCPPHLIVLENRPGYASIYFDCRNGTIGQVPATSPSSDTP